MSCDIKIEDIKVLFQYFRENMYKAKEYSKGTMEYETMNRCVNLIKLDYIVTEINNGTGELSTHYPSKILIPEYEIEQTSTATQTTNFIQSTTTSTKSTQPQTIYENLHDSNKLRNLIYNARYARSRARYPIPVILYKGKYICRSSTLSGGPEIYGRSGLAYFLGSDVKANANLDESDAVEVEETYLNESQSLDEISKRSEGSDWHFIDTVRNQDIKLLKTFNIGTIVDLMVENKKVKFGMNVTSSEKVDKQKRYAKFTILALPYPGCEFFQNYRQNSYSGRGIVYNWNQPFIDANIDVPTDAISSQLHIDWDNYRDWDLVVLTQNYLKLLLKYLRDGNSGLLIHCISGWDRTPLFISLLRICLWADGFIHQSLDVTQLLYLTVSYDWYLFGHNLPDRVNKGEDILHFCFSFLKYVLGDEFSLLDHKHRNKYSSGSSSSIGCGTRHDSESMMMDDILLTGEINGSNISLNSVCSSISGKSHQNIFSDASNSTNGNNNDFIGHNEDSNCSIEIMSVDNAQNDSNLSILRSENGYLVNNNNNNNNQNNSNNNINNNNNNNQNNSNNNINNNNNNNINNNINSNNHNKDINYENMSTDNSSATNITNSNISPVPRRTSPMSVPSAKRYRTESSSSSSSLSSWAVVSNTGSLHSSFKPSTILNNISSTLTTNNTTTITNTATPTAASTITQSPYTMNPLANILDEVEESPSSCNHDLCVLRRHRLRSLRSLFYNSYSTTVGLKVVSGGSFFDNIKDTVGF